MSDINECCELCDNGIELPEGGILCDINNTLVVDDYMSTEDYFWCNDKHFKEKQTLTSIIIEIMRRNKYDS